MRATRRSPVIEDVVRERCLTPVRPAIASFAAALMTRHTPAARAVLAYGSCLRDVPLTEGLVDFYLLVDHYEHTYDAAWERRGNAILPPNVYYAEHGFERAILRAKYAVVSLDQFASKVSGRCSNPYFWARFAQPCAIVDGLDDPTRERVVMALCAAVRTFLGQTRALAPADASPRSRWIAGLEATYATELRSEGTSRATKIVDMDAEYFTALVDAFDAEKPAPDAAQNWRARRIAGKLLSVARLAKAAFTFQGGADYIAWKISRHSDVAIEVKPWHRRHPILAMIVMAPKLWLRGGFR